MSRLPEYNLRVPTIIVRLKLDCGVVVALEAPLPCDDSNSRNALVEIVAELERMLEPWMPEARVSGEQAEIAEGGGDGR